jgi:alpha-N-arabinofuranosidase
VVEAFTGVADYLSIHRYYMDGFTTRGEYYNYMGEGSMDFEEKIVTAQAQINIVKALRPDKTPLKLSVDEWAAMTFDINGVLANAMCLNSFVRHADVVKMANYTMMTSLLSNDQATGATYKSPVFYAFKLFTNNCVGKSVDAFVQCDTFSVGKFSNIPYLDVTSVLSEDGRTVYVNVVNRHKDKSITAEVSNSGSPFTGKAQASLITGELGAFFTSAKQSEYLPKVEAIDVRNGKLTYSFPAHSFTQLSFKLK